VGLLELDATIGKHRLSGKARMNLGMYRAFAKLPCTVNADLATTELSADTTIVATDADWIEFTLSGSASNAQYSLTSSLPAEFTNTITDKIHKQLELQRKESESKLKLALNLKIDELSKQLELLSRNGQETVAKQREALTKMHRELELNLQSREGVEYARLPLKPNTNH
jgi:autotransporter translocation and assembly factor TamB